MRAINDVFAFLGSDDVRGTGIVYGKAPPFNVMNDGDEIVLDWRRGDKHVIVSFDGSGQYGYAMLVDGKYVPGCFNDPVAWGELPCDLKEYFKVMLSCIG